MHICKYMQRYNLHGININTLAANRLRSSCSCKGFKYTYICVCVLLLHFISGLCEKLLKQEEEHMSWFPPDCTAHNQCHVEKGLLKPWIHLTSVCHGRKAARRCWSLAETGRRCHQTSLTVGTRSREVFHLFLVLPGAPVRPALCPAPLPICHYLGGSSQTKISEIKLFILMEEEEHSQIIQTIHGLNKINGFYGFINNKNAIRWQPYHTSLLCLWQSYMSHLQTHCSGWASHICPLKGHEGSSILLRKPFLLQQQQNIFRFPVAIYSWPRCALFDLPPALSSNINHSPSSHPECIYEK